MLIELWADPADTLLIEHDVEIHRHVLPAARRCREPWCSWPYNGPGFKSNGDPQLRESLGCTRFSRKLMQGEPDLVALAASVNQGLPPGDWRRMDAQISPLLKQRGYEVHVHQPPVLHHHVYPNEGCACGKEHE